MVFTFNQVSVTNPLQLESTNFSFMLVTPLICHRVRQPRRLVLQAG